MFSTKRDWGRGFATAGRAKTSSIVHLHFFGPIPNIDVGTSWQYRIQASEAGGPPVSGIAGQADKGCQSNSRYDYVSNLKKLLTFF